MPFRILIVFTALGALSLAACASRWAPSDVAWGQRIATANCASCHATGQEDGSPNPFAPPFHGLRKHYAVLMLNSTFLPGALRGHAPMPSFSARTADLRDLLAYVRSVQDPDSPPWPKAPLPICGLGRVC